MECAICKNKYGFTFGTCCKCGYNYIDNTYHFLEVDAKILELLVSPDSFDYLVKQHERLKKDLYKE